MTDICPYCHKVGFDSGFSAFPVVHPKLNASDTLDISHFVFPNSSVNYGKQWHPQEGRVIQPRASAALSFQVEPGLWRDRAAAGTTRRSLGSIWLPPWRRSMAT